MVLKVAIIEGIHTTFPVLTKFLSKALVPRHTSMILFILLQIFQPMTVWLGNDNSLALLLLVENLKEDIFDVLLLCASEPVRKKETKWSLI